MRFFLVGRKKIENNLVCRIFNWTLQLPVDSTHTQILSSDAHPIQVLLCCLLAQNKASPNTINLFRTPSEPQPKQFVKIDELAVVWQRIMKVIYIKCLCENVHIPYIVIIIR